MKHVRRLEAEPTCLADYRAANPDQDRADETNAGAVWAAFKSYRRVDTGADAPDTCYKWVLEELLKRQQGLCCYCEQRLVDGTGELVFNDYQIEHVLPKSVAKGRTLDWRNLAAACGGGTYRHHEDASRASGQGESCGQTKGNKPLPAGCDPRDFPLSPSLVSVGIDGTLSPDVPACTEVNVSATALELAVTELLALNVERLRFARQEVGDNLRKWLIPLLEELVSASHLQPAQVAQTMNLLIAGRLQPDQHGYLRRFWTAERCALGAPAEAWIQKNTGQFT